MSDSEHSDIEDEDCLYISLRPIITYREQLKWSGLCPSTPSTRSSMSSDTHSVIYKGPVPMYINGKDVSTPDNTFNVTSPLTNEDIWSSSSAGTTHAIEAVEAAEAAFPAWRATIPQERRNILLRAADIMQSREKELGTYMDEETASEGPYSAGFIVPTGIEILRDIAGRIVTALTSSKPVCSQPNRQAIVFKEPYGVILGIVPWNAPYILGMRSICPALAAGNTVVLKGAERSPRCFWAISSVFAQAGLPPGVLNTIYVKPSDGPAVTSALITHPSVKKINFTGSSAVGRVIAEQAGHVLKPCLMELGGKAPAVILPGADLTLAARECVNGAFMHAGQICMSTEKVIVPISLLPSFEAKIEEALNAAYPDKRQCVTLVSTASKTRIDTLISDAIAKGAILLNGDSEAARPRTNGTGSNDHIRPNGTFTADTNGTNGLSGTSPTAKMRPHILKFLPPSSTLYHTESFGPVLCLMTYADGDEGDALRLANDTEYGLSSSVFCGDLAAGLRFARGIESGAVHINGMTVHDEPNLPHGGVKSSGWGRFNGAAGLEEFLVSKTVTWVE